jgi:hypothetical protein
VSVSEWAADITRLTWADSDLVGAISHAVAPDVSALLCTQLDPILPGQG